MLSHIFSHLSPVLLTPVINLYRISNANFRKHSKIPTDPEKMIGVKNLKSKSSCRLPLKSKFSESGTRREITSISQSDD